MNYYDRQIETADREQLRQVQLARLQKQVRFTYENVPHYKQKLDNAGFHPDDLQTLEDIRHIPFSTKPICAKITPTGFLPFP